MKRKELLFEGRSHPLPLCIRRIPGIHHYVKCTFEEIFKNRFPKEKSLLVTGGKQNERSYSVELRLRLSYFRAQVYIYYNIPQQDCQYINVNFFQKTFHINPKRI